MPRLPKFAWRLLPGLIFIFALLFYYPIRTGLSRSAILLAPFAIIACLVVALWKHKRLRWLPLLPPVLLALFLVAPGMDADPRRLRAAYLQSLQNYKGTKYVWGGEGVRGVDCSGLVRAAFVDACLKESLRQRNPSLVWQAFDIWWHDASASELSSGYGDKTDQLAAPIALRDIPPDSIAAGDFAVTADGSHALAYAGNGHWIEADPYPLKVIELSPGDVSGWWIVKVIPCRWRCLPVPGANP